MTGIATGIDMVKIDRFRSLAPAIKTRFLTRVFTPQELEDCGGRDASLAGHFAAKEAAVKALGCGIGEVTWQDIETSLDEQGKPLLILHGAAQEIAVRQSWFTWTVSISHTAEYAVATVSALYERE